MSEGRPPTPLPDAASPRTDRPALRLVARGAGGPVLVPSRWDDAADPAPARPRDQLAHRARLLSADAAIAHGRLGSLSAKALDEASGGCDLLWAAGAQHDLSALAAPAVAVAPLEQVAARGLRDRHLARVGSPHAVEALLHAWVPAAHVDHVHPDAVSAICCSANGAELVHACFGPEAAWVSAGTAGSAERVQAIGRAARTPGVRFVLAAHDGLVAWGASSEGCYAATVEAADRAARFAAAHAQGPRLGGQAITALGGERRTFLLEELLPALRRVLATSDGTPLDLLIDAGPRVRELVCSRDGAMLALDGPASAAHVPFTGRVPLWIDLEPWHEGVAELVERAERAVRRRLVAARRSAGGGVPRVILVAGVGLVTTGVTTAQAELARDVYLRAIAATAGAASLGCYAPLPPP